MPVWRRLSNFDTLSLSDVQHTAAPHSRAGTGLTVSFTAFGRYAAVGIGRSMHQRVCHVRPYIQGCVMVVLWRCARACIKFLPLQSIPPPPFDTQDLPVHLSLHCTHQRVPLAPLSLVCVYVCVRVCVCVCVYVCACVCRSFHLALKTRQGLFHRAAGCRAVMGKGVVGDVPLPWDQFYEGTVIGEPDSYVHAHIDDRGILSAKISLQSEHYHIEVCWSLCVCVCVCVCMHVCGGCTV